MKGSGPKHVYKCAKAPRSMSSRGFRFGIASFVTDCSGPRHKCYVPRSHLGFPSCPHIFTFPSSISSQFASLAFRSLQPEPCGPHLPLTAFLCPTRTLRCDGIFLLPLSSTCKWFWEIFLKSSDPFVTYVVTRNTSNRSSRIWNSIARNHPCERSIHRH